MPLTVTEEEKRRGLEKLVISTSLVQKDQEKMAKALTFSSVQGTC